MPKSVRRKSRESEEGACCGSECCSSSGGCCGVPARGCCEVEAVVSVDARGQMVLPKSVRERFDFANDEKLAVVSWTRNGSPCCLTLMKAEGLAEEVRRTYGPLLRGAV